MEQQELDQLMTDCAQDAVTTSQNEFGITLDYSIDSVALVDDALLSFIDKYHDKALEDQAVFTICNIYGAYIGETFKRHTIASWQYVESQAPQTFLTVGEKTYAFAGICYERLVNDSKISVKAYFDQALAQHTN